MTDDTRDALERALAALNTAQDALAQLCETSDASDLKEAHALTSAAADFVWGCIEVREP